MPLLSGADLSKKLHELRPDLPVIMITGGGRRVPGFSATEPEGREVLPKPLDRRELLAAVRRLLTP
jgi:FixJ family two-component response regulator